MLSRGVEQGALLRRLLSTRLDVSQKMMSSSPPPPPLPPPPPAPPAPPLSLARAHREGSSVLAFFSYHFMLTYTCVSVSVSVSVPVQVLSIVHASAQHGHAELSDATQALHDLRSSCQTYSPTALQYLQILDVAQWTAYWRLRSHAALPSDGHEAHTVASPPVMTTGAPGGEAGPAAGVGLGAIDAEWADGCWKRMEEMMNEAAELGLDLGARAVAICARFARHTCASAAVVKAWQMLRAVSPRSRSAILYAEMMGALGAVGNTEASVGLLRVASKHGLQPSPAMLEAAIEANPEASTVMSLYRDLSSYQQWTLSERAAAIVERAGQSLSPGQG